MRLQTVRRAVAAVVLLAALYAAAGFLLAPWLAQRHLPDLLEESLGREVRVGEFRVNPFLLTLEARRLAVAGHHGMPMLAADRVLADASAHGLLRGTWALDDVLVQGLQAHVVLQQDGTFNFTGAARQRNDAARRSGRAPAMHVKRLVVPDARLIFTDLRGSQAVEATVEDIDLHATRISTATGEPAAHQLSARLPEGGRLSWSGQVALEPSLAADGQVQVRGLRAGTLWPFLRKNLRASGLQGTVDLSGRYVYESDGALRLADISIGASDVLLAGPGDEGRMLQAERITATEGRLDVRERRAGFGELLLADGAARFSVAPDGSLDWGALIDRSPAGASSGGSTAAWGLEIPGLSLQRMDLQYVDNGPGQRFTLDADRLCADLAIALSTGERPQVVASEVRAQWSGATLRMPGAAVPDARVGATHLRQGRFDLAERKIAARELRVDGGRVSIVEMQSQTGKPSGSKPSATETDRWNVSLEQVQVAGLGGRYSRRQGGSPALQVGAIDGKLKLDLGLGGRSTQILASGMDAKVRDLVLSAPGGQPPAARLDSGRLAGASFDLASRRVSAEQVAIEGAVTVVRDASGNLEVPAFAASDATRTEPRAGGEEWRYAIGALQVPSLDFTLVDRTLQPALRLSGTLSGSAKNVASGERASFDAVASLASGGRIRAVGAAEPGASAEARITATGVALTPLQPVLERFAALEVRSGALSGSVQLSYGAGSNPLRAKGSIGIADMVLNEAGSGDRFLSWSQLDAHGLSLDLGQRKLAARELIVVEPGAKIVISQDRKVNLAQVFRRERDPAHGSGGRGKAGRGFVFEVASARLRDGEVDFADLSLVLPFSTTVKALNGTIVDISSEPSHRAGVRARGRIEPYGSASVEGSVVPTEPARFTDLHVEFNNVPVPPLSPYTATFAGRTVTAGRLWLDLHYLVDDGELLGRNDIRLENFRLGERVEAPNALDIPLDLVVAMLSDASGEIRLSVPVTGEVGSARFSVASAVRQALGNALERIVSAPFRALGKLFGGSSDSLASIQFPPGSARLRPEQREKLDALVRALRERPRLQLVVDAPYDPRLDAQALQREQARRALARALGRSVGPREDPGPIAYDDPATRRELERMLRSLAGGQAVQDMARQYTGDGDPRPLYQAMFERIAAEQPLSGAAIQVLAVERAREIADYFQQQGVDRSRVRTGTLTTVRSDQDGHVASQLQVAAGGGG